MSSLTELSPEQRKAHKISWFVYASNGIDRPVKMRHTANMRGHWPGWDAECTCGWSTATGGAVKRWVADAVWGHKWNVKNGFDS